MRQTESGGRAGKPHVLGISWWPLRVQRIHNYAFSLIPLNANEEQLIVAPLNFTSFPPPV